MSFARESSADTAGAGTSVAPPASAVSATTYSPWDIKGPSQSGAAFYRESGYTPPAEKKKPRPTIDIEAIKAFVTAGHSCQDAAEHFGCSLRTVTYHVGSVTKLRPNLCTHKPADMKQKVSIYIDPKAWKWVLSNGGASFLRKLVDDARGAA